MSLLESHEPPPPPGFGEQAYVLLHTAEDGWTLIARHPDRGHVEWTALADHGTGPTAPPRVAQAAAEHALAEGGVTVHHWAPRFHDEHPGVGAPRRPCGGFRAVLTTTQPATRP